MMTEIWIVDDDESIVWVWEKALSKQGYEVLSFHNAEAVLSHLKIKKPSLIISDVKMNGQSGFELLEQINESVLGLPVIIMTAFGDLDSAVSAFKLGAYEYLTKPFDIHEAMALVNKAVASSIEEKPLESALISEDFIVGNNPETVSINDVIHRLSHSTANATIEGEPGTGKSLIAKAIHQHSPLNAAPLIKLDISTIEPDLLETELFGLEKNETDGVMSSYQGRLEQARNGTLYIKHLNMMPRSIQMRLSQAISDNAFYRLGGREQFALNARFIASISQDPDDNYSHDFNTDLYRQLSIVKFHLSPLHERKEDIAQLVPHFLTKAASEFAVAKKLYSDEFIVQLQRYHWPGNILELQQLMNRLTIMVSSQRLSTADIPAEYVSHAQKDEHKDWKVAAQEEINQRLKRGETNLAQILTEQLESILIKSALTYTDGHKIKAAECLGWGRNTLTRKLKSNENST